MMMTVMTKMTMTITLPVKEDGESCSYPDWFTTHRRYHSISGSRFSIITIIFDIILSLVIKIVLKIKEHGDYHIDAVEEVQCQERDRKRETFE